MKRIYNEIPLASVMFNFLWSQKIRIEVCWGRYGSEREVAFEGTVEDFNGVTNFISFKEMTMYDLEHAGVRMISLDGDTIVILVSRYE